MQHLLTVIPAADAFAMTDIDGNSITHRAVIKESWTCLLVMFTCFDLNEDLLAL
jgi:hypothetical protein